ncbi:FAD/FMN-containing dehydrogenase [Malaciobacter marinus]|uniref:D-lactate dehydrogenase (cytochrome) n=1 Tax=Malaciobacter marinus TaxID=505249 RepID=A0A347TGZ9_9BACT|nr:FAD-binding and (Fe-S)-binding domain-containing protein [Malaciobacter marinus]AXX85877.1 FAD/FMN-containing dehydrogenase [Malaciobacter marinus]PHO14999.1 4Fe-4S ferredoxin [Malaciobacter marinus]
MLAGKYQDFYNQIINKIPQEIIYTDDLHTLAYGTDASFYRLIPKLVIKVENSKQVKDILQLACNMKLSVTFRAAGTSLSGQAISDSILVITSRNWTDFKIAEDKSHVSLSPSLTGAQANNILAPFSKKIGPDPASINSAMIGGIAANNASGMCCGVAQNSYKTLKSMKLVFSDGTQLDTGNEDSKAEFAKTHKEFLQSLKMYAKNIKDDEELSAKIRKKFKMKNTTGYSLNALVDFEDEFEILQHLIIGSEGTLAFIKEVTYYTVEDYKDKASALVYFKDVNEACKAVTKLKLEKQKNIISVDAVELMDRAGLASIEDDPKMPSYIKEFDENVTALLIETRAKSDKELDTQIKQIEDSLKEFSLAKELYFTKDVEEYTQYWKIRKGLFPAVGAVRKIGTTVIIEDIAFPIEYLAEGTLKLQGLFKQHKYNEALIFGHALEGNLHFVFTQDFSTQEEIQRYDDFMYDVTQLVAVQYQGSLKAEHGTGRNMAAFVELEWGNTAYEMMKKIKSLFDPNNILNPGVIINDDKKAHIKNLKPLPKTNDLVDKCIECGFCEPVCPSNVLTLTPRQRIVINREISRLEDEEHNLKKAKELKQLYQYDGIETCATCSLCSTACPVGIDTGSLTKYLRHEQVSSTQNKVANVITNNFSATLTGMKFGLKAANLTHTILGTSLMSGLTSGLRKISSDKIPRWSEHLPKGISINTRIEQKANSLKVVYFPSCINRTMGLSSASKEEKELFDTTVELLQKAGFEIIFPKQIDNLCCGMPFSSKGFTKQAKIKSDELETALNEASNNGQYPILCDTSPCTKKMMESFNSNLDLYEPIEFALEHLVDKLELEKIDEAITIHTTCSSRKMGLHEKFIKLANMCSSKVIVPSDVTCCGFAGDRGFSYPELNQSALRNLPKSVKDAKYAFSTSKTCEIGLSEYSGIDYNSIFYLINKCSKAK